MPAPIGIRLTLCTQIAVAAFALCLMLRGSAAQPLVFGRARPTAVELSAPHIAEISGTTAARLEQAAALAARENWSDAVDALREIASEDDDRVVPLGDDRFVSLATYCHMQIARWPGAGLVAYRHRVDPQAERWYRDGLAGRDEAMLRRVVDEMFCSRWGDDALLLIGELALERGDYGAARRAWERINPLTRDPAGRPMWLALADIDLDTYWPEVERKWNERTTPTEWLAYPDADLDLADVRARLILASIRADELDRAAIELDAFRRFHPAAAGRFARQEGRYVDLLDRLFASDREWPTGTQQEGWPTFAGSPCRTHIAEALSPAIAKVWTKPLATATAHRPRAPYTPAAFDANRLARNLLDDDQAPPDLFPVTNGSLLLLGDSERLWALNLATGNAAITADGVLCRAEETTEEIPDVRVNFSHAPLQLHPQYTLTVADNMLYARIGRKDTHRQQVESGPIVERLVGVNLNRDGLLTFQARPDDPSWAFDGAPLSDGRRVFVAMRHSDATPHAYVASFDAATGKELWRTSIGGADTPVDALGRAATSNLLTLVGGRIYFNSNLGLIAALDSHDGRIEWLYRYPRATNLSALASAERIFLQRNPSPCVYSNGLLFIAPSDTPNVFALDAATGHAIWSNDQLPDMQHLLGVDDDSLVVTGSQLWILSTRTGRVRRVWPESKHAGIRGMGRGVIAGREVFWPTRKEILTFDVESGAQTRSPYDLSPIGGNGANLIAAEGYLIATGRKKVMAFGPPSALTPPVDNDESNKATEAIPIADRN